MEKVKPAGLTTKEIVERHAAGTLDLSGRRTQGWSRGGGSESVKRVRAVQRNLVRVTRLALEHVESKREEIEADKTRTPEWKAEQHKQTKERATAMIESAAEEAQKAVQHFNASVDARVSEVRHRDPLALSSIDWSGLGDSSAAIVRSSREVSERLGWQIRRQAREDAAKLVDQGFDRDRELKADGKMAPGGTALLEAYQRAADLDDPLLIREFEALARRRVERDGSAAQRAALISALDANSELGLDEETKALLDHRDDIGGIEMYLGQIVMQATQDGGGTARLLLREGEKLFPELMVKEEN